MNSNLLTSTYQILLYNLIGSCSPNNPYPNLPGGSAQTKEYYSNSSLRKRKSLDRSSSIRRIVGVVAKMDELKVVANVGVGANVIARFTSAPFVGYCVWHFRDLNKIPIIIENTLRKIIKRGCEKYRDP